MPKTTKKGTQLEIVGEGDCRLDQNGLSYLGSSDGEFVHYYFPLQLMPTLLFGCREDFEIYHENQFYYFVPKNNLDQVIKWSIYTEAAYESFVNQK